MEENKIELSKSREDIKLDLACGQSPQEGYKGVDFYAANADFKVDLFKFPFPWDDGSIDGLYCSHFIEHLPARDVEEKDILSGGEKYIGHDFLFAFFDECWRILKKDCIMKVVVPNCRSNRAFQDPTHRRFIVAEMFLYLSAEWRKLTKLDHYNVNCNFAVDVQPIIPAELALLHPEAQSRRFNESWNTILDWHAKLIKI